jgi:murein DD-endopeptidase MepM/ murein hydrolase activator NlpD
MHRETHPRVRSTARALVLVLAALAWGCEQVEQVRDHYRDRTPHEAYLASLQQAGLATSALARDWMEAGNQAVDQALEVGLPYSEAGFITPEEPEAVAYRITVGRGQRLHGEVTLETEDDTRLFVDLFRVPDDPGDRLRPVLSVDSVPGSFSYEPWRGGDFILRLQPELLRGGRYHVTLRLEAQLAFPVEGLDTRAIQSVFGASREAGRRQHHGVDIFARRGTPALAAADGVVGRVELTNLGGKVVWLRDPARRANLYYAHLDSQNVVPGQRVSIGDTLGFVGNTGNARTTPPHLHFGVYRRGEGPVDPDPFIRRPRGRLPDLTADLARLGDWVRMENEGIRLRGAPSLRADVVDELQAYTPLRVLGAVGDWYRVRLPDGGAGYVAARLTEGLDVPVETRVAAADGAVQYAPDPASPVVDEVAAGSELGVLGRFHDYLYVQSSSGRVGWMGVEASRP